MKDNTNQQYEKTVNQFLTKSTEIKEGESKGWADKTDCGAGIFAIRKQGKLFVYRNQCPHRGLPLEWIENQFLDSSGELIQCSSHGALFTIEQGRCIAGPCVGQTLTPIEHEERDGFIFIK